MTDFPLFVSLRGRAVAVPPDTPPARRQLLAAFGAAEGGEAPWTLSGDGWLEAPAAEPGLRALGPRFPFPAVAWRGDLTAAAVAPPDGLMDRLALVLAAQDGEPGDGSRRRFPLFCDLRGRPVLLVGGGAIAARRAAVLAAFGAALTVAAPEIAPAIRALPGVCCREMPWEPALLEEAALALAATDDPAVNGAVAAAARARRIPVNDASDQRRCDFHFPAIARRPGLVVGVTGGGTDHGLVRRAAAAIRKALEELP